jgi:uncharacterized membrane protein
LKTTLLGGILFLVPVAFVAIVLGKIFEISMVIATPLDGLVPLTSVAGVATANIIAIFLILAVCFLAGLLARRSFFSDRMGRLDDFLIDLIPGYAVTKGILGGVANKDDAMAVLRPVLVQFDDYDQIAFEVERDSDNAVIFLPGSPSAWSGVSVVVAISRVTTLNVPPHQAVSLLRVMGRGSLKLKTDQTP